MDALTSPFSAALKSAVAQLYNVFDANDALHDLDVCRCPVCVDVADTYMAMTTVPPKDWPTNLIVQYSNSAHGTPENYDHLRALFPRYLEVIAADDMVDFNGIGTELLRFGDAWRAEAAFFNNAQKDAIAVWFAAALDHFIWMNRTKDGALYTATHVIEVFLVMGWPVSELRKQVEARLNDLSFAAEVARWLTQFDQPKAKGYRPDIFGLQYLSSAQFKAFFTWLNDPQFAAQFAAFAAMSDDVDQDLYFGQVAARQFISISGQYRA